MGDAFVLMSMLFGLLLAFGIVCLKAQESYVLPQPVTFHSGVCCICLDGDISNLSWTRAQCGHTFHRSCATTLRQCPLCMQRME
jgi:hypothetical protein